MFERKLYIVRKRAEKEIAESEIEDKEFFYIPSLSCRTIVYKGLLLAPQIANFYGELSDPDVTSALCLVHQRFSTNTFPSWKLAHPYRYIAHNGEINTLKGNVAWMNARQSILETPAFNGDIKKLFPIIQPGGSDSAQFRQCCRTATMSGRSIPHVMAMLIPEAWAGNPHIKPEKKSVLRVSRLFDGAMGRPCCDSVHRRKNDRRDSGSQWSAPRPLRGDA